MEPDNGQLMNDILKRSGMYHPDSTRIGTHRRGHFKFTNVEYPERNNSETYQEDIESHLPESLSIERSGAQGANLLARHDESKNQIEIEDTEMQRRLNERESRLSEAYSNIELHNQEIIVTDETKNTMLLLDRSEMSQFD